MGGNTGLDDRQALRYRWATAVIIGTVTALRVAYLFAWCPYDLAPDEAHYWDWSRHLDWSYYSKGPLVAWLIRASCEVFGPVSVAWHGTLMPAVRLPAVLCGGLTLAAVYVLTVQTFRDDRLALGVVLAALTMPPVAVCAVVMTIDAPFLCLWAWALAVGRLALVDGKRWAWPAAGLLIALGILAKYTMALWLVSAGLFILFTPTHRRLLMRPGFWVMVGVAGLSALPILWWNSQHDWVTFRHVAGQAGVNSDAKAGIRWLGPLSYVGEQFGLLLGYWFVAWASAMVIRRPSREIDPGIRYLWWMSLPTFALFGLTSLRSAGQVNWPVAAYLSGLVLAASYVARILQSPNNRLRRTANVCLTFAASLGLFLSFLVHDTRMIVPFLARFVGPETEDKPTPIRAIDPASRLKGWQFLAGEVDTLRAQVRATDGADPVVTAVRWDLPGQLGFYCAGHPPVYSLGLIMRDRHSQYDLWRPNPLDDAQVFFGRSFVFVGMGDPERQFATAFDSVEPRRDVTYREHGQAIGKWSIWVCHGFKGFDPALRATASPAH